MTLGKKIKNIRKRLCISQDDLASIMTDSPLNDGNTTGFP